MKTFHLSKNKSTNRSKSDANYIPDNPNRDNEESKTDKIAHRLRHKERGQLLKEPENKSFHIIHGLSPPQV